MIYTPTCLYEMTVSSYLACSNNTETNDVCTYYTDFGGDDGKVLNTRKFSVSMVNLLSLDGNSYYTPCENGTRFDCVDLDGIPSQSSMINLYKTINSNCSSYMDHLERTNSF